MLVLDRAAAVKANVVVDQVRPRLNHIHRRFPLSRMRPVAHSAIITIQEEHDTSDVYRITSSAGRLRCLLSKQSGESAHRSTGNSRLHLLGEPHHQQRGSIRNPIFNH